MSKYSRSNATFKNYAISLGIVVGILLVMSFVVSGRSVEHIPTVNYRPDIEVLRQSADYEVMAPSEELPQGWTPTSSTLDVTGPVEWSIGFATPEDSHAMLTQSDGDPDAVVRDRVKDAEPVGTVMVADQEWERFDTEDWGAIVQRGDDRTLIISGSTSLDEFAVLAAHLETLPVPEEGESSEEEDGEGDASGTSDDS
ncbi:DUF4245 domain-containing protein [Nocardiopsis alkaliphila]|uniref:DUF4245 domain-containing protein n=1 Tax=Nocardiopsis alkaliphila TaxID=225762 RepID=UPI0003466693|nr:DUF4245 domain-containing protein [Nocardiopsis alkaliphila]